ncbi:hypothetical protein KOR42_20850 [Thalassoglobus neptunius]|uniref:Uncharacterized protein n=1 Tax=Thalassoglobus neptunius TaxID=1938619 RepID=A0A5C5X7Q2_9PLAN|nr:DUF4303 domain-containing protein [Thalassoglobus neptunius]TWT58699.1 hypothetical protein KOR42_20850 [Thalassoglobus neptunius]
MASNFINLADHMAAMAIAGMAALQEDDLDREIYAFAVCVDHDVTSCYWTANSEQALEEYSRNWLSKTQKRFPTSRTNLPQAIALHRRDQGAWSFHNEQFTDSNETVAACHRQANDTLSAIWDLQENRLDPFGWRTAFTRKRCIRSIIKGLQIAKQTVYQQQPEKTCIIKLWVNDTDDVEENLSYARRLNSSQSLNGFL